VEAGVVMCAAAVVLAVPRGAAGRGLGDRQPEQSGPVLSSGHRTLKGEDQTLDGPRSDAPLDVRVSDGFELPALPRLVVQDLLQLVPRRATRQSGSREAP